MWHSCDKEKEIRYSQIVNSKRIPERLFALRKAYDLALVEMSFITENLLIRATLNLWEVGKRQLSLDGLIIISSCFGVSVNWLCGMSDIPYTEDSLKIARKTYLNGKEKTFGDYKITDEFLSSYPLEVQANIIVLLKNYEMYENTIKKPKRLKKRIDNIIKAITEKTPVCKIRKSVQIEYY